MGERPHIVLGERFAAAVAYATWLHRDQTRKSSTVPYSAHLLGAASFLIEQPGCSEDQAIAALLHDAIEDQPHRTDYDDVAARFGADVARIVRDCTDAEVHPKPPWRHRKEAYIRHLEHVPTDSLMVSLADKLHNARAMLTDGQLGRDEWTRFTAPPPAQRWYYTSLAEIFARRLDSDHAHALGQTVAAVFAAVPSELDLPAVPDRPEWVGTGSVTAWASDIDEAQTIAATDLHRRDGARGWADADGAWWAEQVPGSELPVLLFVRPPTALGR